MLGVTFGIWSLGFGIWDLLSSALGRLARDAAPIGAAAAISELLEREAVSDQFPFELRLTRRARRAVLEFVRRLRVAGAVDKQARAPFRRGRANQPHRFRATGEQPDCFDEAGDQARAVYPTPRAPAKLPSLMPDLVLGDHDRSDQQASGGRSFVRYT